MWPAAAGMVLLLVAVETYYVAAVLFLDDSTSQLWAPKTLFWLVLAVLAGAAFGTAGGWSTERSGLRRALGAALPTAVLLAEAGLLATRPDNGDAAYRTDSLQTAAIEVVLAVLCLLVATRRHPPKGAGPHDEPAPGSDSARRLPPRRVQPVTARRRHRPWPGP